MINSGIEPGTFFADPALDNDLPMVNEVFWSSLIGHIEQDCSTSPRVILDVGCHTGGLLQALNDRFTPEQLIGIEPLALARLAALQRLGSGTAKVMLLDASDWDRIPAGAVDLTTSHEVLYLEPDVLDFMRRVRRVLASTGVAYVVLGCHSENPLWQTWKIELLAAGHHVYDHNPLEIMEAASSAGLLPSVQPLRRSGWVTYDPLHAEFRYPDLKTMFDHHYRHKLIFRLRIAEAARMPEKPKRRNATKAVPLAEIDSERERLPADRVKLSSKERALLKDPDWIDEDEADAILAMRIDRDEEGQEIPFRDYLRSRGRTVAD